MVYTCVGVCVCVCVCVCMCVRGYMGVRLWAYGRDACARLWTRVGKYKAAQGGREKILRYTRLRFKMDYPYKFEFRKFSATIL